MSSFETYQEKNAKHSVLFLQALGCYHTIKTPHQQHLFIGKSFMGQPNLKTDKVLLLQAFNSILEAHLKRGEFNTQAFCPFFGHLICWHKRLIIRTPVKVIWKNKTKKLRWKFYVKKIKSGGKEETSHFGFMVILKRV
jgi:hypothetical protein